MHANINNLSNIFTMKSEDISRRSFLKRAAALSAAAAIPSFWIPSKANAMPGVPFVSANEKVRIAFIGIGTFVFRLRFCRSAAGGIRLHLLFRYLL